MVSDFPKAGDDVQEQIAQHLDETRQRQNCTEITQGVLEGIGAEDRVEVQGVIENQKRQRKQEDELLLY